MSDGKCYCYKCQKNTETKDSDCVDCGMSKTNTELDKIKPVKQSELWEINMSDEKVCEIIEAHNKVNELAEDFAHCIYNFTHHNNDYNQRQKRLIVLRAINLTQAHLINASIEFKNTEFHEKLRESYINKSEYFTK